MRGNMPSRPTTDPRSGSILRRFVRGAFYPFRGAGFLVRNTDLWGWAAAPLMLTFAAILGAGWVTFLFTDDLIALLWPRPTQDLVAATVWWIAVRTLQVLVFLTTAAIAWVVGNMIGSPFWDVLAERTEHKLLERQETPFDLQIALGDAFMSVRHSMAGLLLYLFVMIPALLLNLVPGIGTAAYTALTYPATMFFLAREVMDIPLSRRRTPFVSKLRWMAGHKALLGGLGTTSMLLLVVPFVNVLVMPFAVMGGTLLYCHLHQVGAGVPQCGPRRPLSVAGPRASQPSPPIP